MPEAASPVSGSEGPLGGKEPRAAPRLSRSPNRAQLSVLFCLGRSPHKGPLSTCLQEASRKGFAQEQEEPPGRAPCTSSLVWCLSNFPEHHLLSDTPGRRPSRTPAHTHRAISQFIRFNFQKICHVVGACPELSLA